MGIRGNTYPDDWEEDWEVFDEDELFNSTPRGNGRNNPAPPRPDPPPLGGYPGKQKARRNRKDRRSRGRGGSLVSPATKVKLVTIAAFLLIISLLGMCVMNYDDGGYSIGNYSNNPQVEEVVTVQDLFVDLNGDGKIDYLKSGQVIFNKSP